MKERLSGIDLVRVFAAFDVICIHAPLVCAAVNSTTQLFQSFLGFSVPFFLVTAFYFATDPSKLPLSTRELLVQAGRRLLIPYTAWTIIYSILKLLKYFPLYHEKSISYVFTDPQAVIFMGGSGVQMYYLPLLFVGFSLYYTIRTRLHKLKTNLLLLLLLAGGIVQFFTVSTGNNYRLDRCVAFMSVLPDQVTFPFLLMRFPLVVIAHAIRCFPIMIAVVLLRRYINLIEKIGYKRSLAIIISLIALLELFKRTRNYACSDDLIIGMPIFLLGYILSAYIKPTNTLKKNWYVYIRYIFITSNMVGDDSDCAQKVAWACVCIRFSTVYAYLHFMLSYFPCIHLVRSKKPNCYVFLSTRNRR